MSRCTICGTTIGRDQLGYFTHPANGCSSASPVVKPVSPSPDLGGLIGRLDDLSVRLRANRYEVHGDCCNDTDEAVPCGSAVCKIEYEAELLLREALTVLHQISALVPKWRSEAASEQRVSFCADELEAVLKEKRP